jgi:hypothetical protein
MPGPFTTLLQRIDPQRMTVIKTHRQALRAMGTADVAYVRQLDLSARQQVKEAIERVKLDFKAMCDQEAPQS